MQGAMLLARSSQWNRRNKDFELTPLGGGVPIRELFQAHARMHAFYDLTKYCKTLSEGEPGEETDPEMLAFVQNYTDMGFFSILLFLFIGTILTMIVQASAATMAITLIMCANGWISLELGAALVLGENIGTTITANLAALTANTQAKRAALAHFVFNVFGVIWVLIIFHPFMQLVNWVVDTFFQTSNPEVAISYKLSAFHSIFNLSLIHI